MHARISRSLFWVARGAALMYAVTVLGFAFNDFIGQTGHASAASPVIQPGALGYLARNAPGNPARPAPEAWSLEPAAEAATRPQLPRRSVSSSAPYPAMLIDSVKY